MNATTVLAGQLADLTDGAEFTTRGRTITEGDLTSFSALTGDWHPQHSDAEWAAQSRFSCRIAHGMLVLSYAIGLMPFDPDRVVALRGLGSATFKRPVAIGDTIRVRYRVESTRSLDDETALVTLALRVINQAGRVAAFVRLDAIWRGVPPFDEKTTSEASADPTGQSVENAVPLKRPGPWSRELMHLYGGEMFL